MRVVFILVTVLLSTSFTTEDFNTRAIKKLSEITKSPVPTKIEIEVVPQKKIADAYRDIAFNECIGGNPHRIPQCAEHVSNMQFYIHGMWIPEKDPRHLHLMLDNHAGADAIIHEYLHWWLHNQTVPVGLINSESIVKTMSEEILASKVFTDWLGGG